MTAHVVLAESEVWAAWEAERVDLASRRGLLAAQIAEVNAADAKAQETHAAKVAEATRKGKPIPTPPTPVERAHLDRALSVQNADEEAHRDRRDQVYADASAEAHNRLTAREQARHARLSALAPEITEILAEHHEDARLTRDLTAAVDRRAGLSVRPSRAERIDLTPDLSTILAAALAGRTLLDPRPLPAPHPDRVQVDTDPVHGFGYDDRDRPPPPPRPRGLSIRERFL